MKELIFQVYYAIVTRERALALDQSKSQEKN